jgi:hypothetical protein
MRFYYSGNGQKILLELILKWILKYRCLLYYGGIMTSLGRGGRPGLAGAAGKGIHLLPAGGKHISVGKQYAGHKIALALQGTTV